MYRSILLLSALLLAAWPAAAQPDLGTLDVPADRVCHDTNSDGSCDDYWWKSWDLPDTSSWQQITINCGGDNKCSRSEVQSALNQANGSGQIFIVPQGTHTWDDTSIRFSEDKTVLRCEGKAIKSNPDTTIRVGDGANPAQVVVGSYSENSSTSWNAGYSRGTTVVTVGNAGAFSVGDWVSLRASGGGNICSNLWDNPVGTDNRIQQQTAHRTKIVAINGNTVTIESPLRFDIDSCGGSKIMSKINATKHSGVENCHFLGDGMGGDKFIGMISIDGIESWAMGNKLENTGAFMASLSLGARLVWRDNWAKDSNLNERDVNGAIEVYSVSDAVVENNIFQNLDEAINIKSGTDGLALAYNYWLGPLQNKGLFMHGGFPREILMEGNDAEQPVVTDNYWGRNGPLVLFRNRIRDNRDGATNNAGDLGIVTLDYGSGPTNTRLTVVANFLNWMHHQGGLCTDAHYDQCPDGWVFDRSAEKVHVEKNVCFGEEDGSPSRDCIRLGTVTDGAGVNRDTSCGNGGTGAGDCPYNATAQTVGDNKMDALVKPASWANDTIPVSLYRSEPPSWWCQEACPWSTGGIGAFGDDARNGFSQLCKIPAQILFEGGTCTPLDGSVGEPPPPRPDPPVLLTP